MSLQPRAVLVSRRSEYDELLMRHGTRGQAAFFLEQRGRNITELEARHDTLTGALEQASGAIPADWRRANLVRDELHRFEFAPEDVVIVVGQDGLVANVAKYLNGQPVVGVNPEPDRFPGVLVPHHRVPAQLLQSSAAGKAPVEARTMVSAQTDDGLQLNALNEVYFGHRRHQSARYQLQLPDGQREDHSSSGVLAGTGTGATGWLRSAWQERHSPLRLPEPTESQLCWFVREAWPSKATGANLTEGMVDPGAELTLRCESDELICFGDGIESDAIVMTWGQSLTITTATQRLNLIVADSA